jgi:hypothetical protein
MCSGTIQKEFSNKRFIAYLAFRGDQIKLGISKFGTFFCEFGSLHSLGPVI